MITTSATELTSPFESDRNISQQTIELQTAQINVSNSCFDTPYEFPVVMQATLTLFVFVAALFSTIGNLVAFLIVFRKRTMRSAINILLANMALSDIILSVIFVPTIISEFITGLNSVSLNVYSCLFIFQQIFISVGTFTLLIISMDRYLIIVYRKDKLTPRTAKLLIGIAWCFSFLLSLVQFIGYLKKKGNTDNITCIDIEQSYQIDVYSIFSVSASYLIPILIMSYSYACICKAVWKNSLRIHNYPGSTVSVSVTQYSSKLGLPTVARPYKMTVDLNFKRRAFETIFILFLVYVTCWLSYAVHEMVISCIYVVENKAAKSVLLCFGFVKSAFYPIVYGCRIKKYRESFAKFVPKFIPMSLTFASFNQRRINPSSVYEFNETNTSTGTE